MPRKAKSAARGPSKKRVRRNKDEALSLLQKIEAQRAGGMTLAKVLAQIGIHYNTYLRWVKLYGKPSAVVPAAQEGLKRLRRGADEVRKVLGEIAALRRAGKSKAEAVAEAGVSPHTYKYWVKKFGSAGAPKAKPGRKPAAAGKKPVSVVGLLQEMMENRKRRAELEQAAKQIAALDARYGELRSQLENE